jgi:hypothetical protein
VPSSYTIESPQLQLPCLTTRNGELATERPFDFTLELAFEALRTRAQALLCFASPSVGAFCTIHTSLIKHPFAYNSIFCTIDQIADLLYNLYYIPARIWPC